MYPYKVIPEKTTFIPKQKENQNILNYSIKVMAILRSILYHLYFKNLFQREPVSWILLELMEIAQCFSHHDVKSLILRL